MSDSSDVEVTESNARTAPRSRFWVITINNPDGEVASDCPENLPDFMYLVYQLEQGATGTVHWQGYVVFESRKRLSYLKRFLPRAHLEIRRGTHEQARDYCMMPTKEDGAVALTDPIVLGCERDVIRTSGSGTRTDLLRIQDMVNEGASTMEIADNHFPTWVTCHRAIDRYILMKAPKRRWVPEVYVFFGVPGTGKSALVHEMCGDDLYSKPPGSKWFDGYFGQHDVFIDEFNGWWPEFGFDELLQVTDRYPLMVPTKGGFANFAPKRVFIASNYDPCEWFPTRLWTALDRRITCIAEFQVPDQPPVVRKGILPTL